VGDLGSYLLRVAVVLAENQRISPAVVMLATDAAASGTASPPLHPAFEDQIE
jgi:hypothetical protein